MMSSCDDGDALSYVPLGSIRLWYALGICQLICNMVVDLVLALVAGGRLTVMDWKDLKVQGWLFLQLRRRSNHGVALRGAVEMP